MERSRRTILAPVFMLGLRRMTQGCAFLDRKVGDAEMRRDYSWGHLQTLMTPRVWWCRASGLDLYLNCCLNTGGWWGLFCSEAETPDARKISQVS